ncbi:hypothetical protein [Streptomyces showdoensis]|uniref:hypothetical protein n=1 Tax=Streptomyces showdoensis TaxID=68268 RepID=UPI0010398D55|nr:hypothetical protein [Streptomyces showdoensis]
MPKTRRRALVEGFWALDRFLGGKLPPTRVQLFVGRHPLALAAAIGLAVFAVFAAPPDTQAVDIQAGLVFGALLGLTYYGTATYERARQRRLIRDGIWEPRTTTTTSER